ncbi:MAG: PAS domain-containing protein [Planctomycetes bacterium]|nr:PAS domain-containing protein [Planctomycetota bacterium]
MEGLSLDRLYIIADNDVNITYWNNEAENIFQYTEAEVSGNQLNKYNVSPPKMLSSFACKDSKI